MTRLEDMGRIERELFLMGYSADEAAKLAPTFEQYAAASGAGLDAALALARSELDRRWRERLIAKPSWWKFWQRSDGR